MESSTPEQKLWLSLPDDEKEWLFERFQNRSRRTGQAIEDIKTNFLIWFRKVKQIDVTSLTQKELQQHVDELLNTKEGQDNFTLATQGFFHCWIKSARIKFLKMTQNCYCESVDSIWRITSSWKEDRNVVVLKIDDYFRNDELEHLLQQMNQQVLRFGKYKEEIITSFTKWFFTMKHCDVRFLKEEETQPLIDTIFNSTEGKENLQLLSEYNYKCTQEWGLPLFQLTDPKKCEKFETTWWVKFDSETGRYVKAQKDKL